MQFVYAAITLLCLISRCRYTHAHWNTTASHAFLKSSECTIARLKASKVTASVFREHFLERTPLIVTDLVRCYLLCNPSCRALAASLTMQRERPKDQHNNATFMMAAGVTHL